MFPSERVPSTAAFRSGVRRFGGHAHGSRKAALEARHRAEMEAKHGPRHGAARVSTVSWGSFEARGSKKKRYPESKYADPRVRRGGAFTSSAGRCTPGERAGLFGKDSGGPAPRPQSERRSVSMCEGSTVA